MSWQLIPFIRESLHPVQLLSRLITSSYRHSTGSPAALVQLDE